MPSHKPAILSTYLGKIIRRLSIDTLRKRSRQKRSQYNLSLSELEDCVPGGENPEREIEGKLLTEKINLYLATLPKETRDVFVGRYYFMDSVKKVSAYTNMSESKAKSLLFRARNELKLFLEKEGFSI
jgi:RNA polymerase sigma-70 factor (ECF subfamily)